MGLSKYLPLRRLLLTVVLVVGLPAALFAAQAVRPPDVPGDHWAAPAVMALIRPETELIEVLGDNKFYGGQTLIRYDFVKNLDNLVRYLEAQGLKLGPGGPLPDCPYTDVKPAHYAYPAVRHLLWMIPGDKRLFNGTQALTRLDMAVWLYRLLKDQPKSAAVKLAKAPADVDAGLAPMVCWALAASEDGLISSYPDGKFRPDGPLTRYEMAYAMYQVLRWLTQTMPAPAEVVQATTAAATPAADNARPELHVFEPEVEGSRDFVVVAKKKQIQVVGIAADDTGIKKVTVNAHEAALAFADEADLKKADLKGPVAAWFRVQVALPEPAADGKVWFVIEVTDKSDKKETRKFSLKPPKPDAPQVVQAAIQPPGTQRVARKWALLVGVNRYDDGDNIPALRYSVGDVTAVYQALVDPKRGGFGSDSVFLLTDETPDKPTNVNVIKYLNRIARRAEPEDLVLVYYSGHGYEENGRGYILPCNTDVEALAASAIDNSVFTDTLDRMKAQRIVTILDACHSGAVRRAGGSPSLSDGYFAAYKGARGRVVLASASAGQKAWEDAELRHGVFTKFMKDGVGGQADRNRDGAITFMELARFVSENVIGWAKAHGKEQDPVVQAENLSAADIVLALNPDAIPTGPVAEKKRKIYTLLEPEDADYACALIAKAKPSDAEQKILKWIDRLVEAKVTPDAYLGFIRTMAPGK